MPTLLAHLDAVPVVGTLAFRERLTGLPAQFDVTLTVEPQNRYNPGAVAVLLPNGAKAGYIAPDIARHVAPIVASRNEPTRCPARLTPAGARLDAGILLNFSTFNELHI
jgi:hypothetical protein